MRSADPPWSGRARGAWGRPRPQGIVLASIVGFLAAGRAHAGGSSENVLLLVDPTRPDALQVANHYVAVRNLPAQNVLYMDPSATSFAGVAAYQHPALLGKLTSDASRDHIDYIVLPPAASFYVDAAGLIEDPCYESRISLSTAYYACFIAGEILSGELSYSFPNRYRSAGQEPYGFDSNILWRLGEPSVDGRGRYMFLASMLGYTGPRGNTVNEILDMIDRSAAVDGTRPIGTIYFMETADTLRSDLRDWAFDDAVATVAKLGGQAEHLYDILPQGRHDVLGVMTGWASPDIDGADMTLLPGAICDHATSAAAWFDIADQTKVSRWIAKGASGSYGTVDEPCAFRGKFPQANLYYFYLQGANLAESILRSVEYTPFQGLLYGDPLTQPFAYLPQVEVSGLPDGPASGTILLTPSATTAHPHAQIAEFELLIDGVSRGTVPPGGAFTVDTTQLADAWHDWRMLAYDDSRNRAVGRWSAWLDCDNRGRGASLGASPSSGDLSTLFRFQLNAAGGPVREVRLIQNGRVLAARPDPGDVYVHGAVLGAGSAVRVQCEVLFEDREAARSVPNELYIDAAGGGIADGAAPQAFGYTRYVRHRAPLLLELPASTTEIGAKQTTVLVPPAQAQVVESPGLSGANVPYRLLRVDPHASGQDALTFDATDSDGTSAAAAVTLIYDLCPADVNDDRRVDSADLSALLAHFGSTVESYDQGDVNGDGVADLADLSEVLLHFGAACQ